MDDRVSDGVYIIVNLESFAKTRETKGVDNNEW